MIVFCCWIELEESEEEEEVSVSHERSQERTEWKETYTKRDQSEPKQLSPESMSSLQIEVTNLKHDVHSLLKSRQHTHDALGTLFIIYFSNVSAFGKRESFSRQTDN
eukprot:UN01243